MRDAAAANSSEVAISVVSNSRPYKSFSPTLLQRGEIPEHPIAVPIAPNLNALPWVSVMMTAISSPNSSSKDSRISKADLSD